MLQVPIAADRVREPFQKNVPEINVGRDGCRTPMQWDASAHAGFSQAQPWLPVGETYQHENVEKQRRDNASLYNLYRRLIALRRARRALVNGSYRPLRRAAICCCSFANMRTSGCWWRSIWGATAGRGDLCGQAGGQHRALLWRRPRRRARDRRDKAACQRGCGDRTGSRRRAAVALRGKLGQHFPSSHHITGLVLRSPQRRQVYAVCASLTASRASRRTATSEIAPVSILRDGAARLLRMRSVVGTRAAAVG